MKLTTLLVTALLLLLTLPARAESLEAAFLASDVAFRIRALGYPIVGVTPLDGQEAIVAYYLPLQSAASDWDDETRLVLYAWHGAGQFERKQFISKAGDSVSGRLAGLVSEPVGEGRLVAAVGTPVGPDHLVKSLIFYRPSPTDRFRVVFKRKDLGAAIQLKGDRLIYTHQEFDAAGTRRFEKFSFQDGAFVATDPSPSTAAETQ